MNCLVCGRGPMLTWGDKSDGRYDYYCSAHHGPLGVGIFYKEIWDGEKYVLTAVKPTADEVKTWPKPSAPSAETSSSTETGSSSASKVASSPSRAKASSSRTFTAMKRSSSAKRASKRTKR